VIDSMQMSGVVEKKYQYLCGVTHLVMIIPSLCIQGRKGEEIELIRGCVGGVA
jgi:hypothetical protein